MSNIQLCEGPKHCNECLLKLLNEMLLEYMQNSHDPECSEFNVGYRNGWNDAIQWMIDSIPEQIRSKYSNLNVDMLS